MVLFCLGSEKKEVRRLAAWGVINVVKVTWLEDCNKAKKEVKVSPTHMATELVLLSLKTTLPQTPHSAGSLRHWVRPF